MPILDPDFIKEVLSLLTDILAMGEAKRVEGAPMTGPLMASLLRVGVETINTASPFPNIGSDAWLGVLHARAQQDITNNYHAKLQALAARLPLAGPVLTAEVSACVVCACQCVRCVVCACARYVRECGV